MGSIRPVPQFVPGIELARAFYEAHVAASLDGVPHAAALLGFDTERSTDHAWGPRLQVFVAAERVEEALKKVEA